MICGSIENSKIQKTKTKNNGYFGEEKMRQKMWIKTGNLISRID